MEDAPVYFSLKFAQAPKTGKHAAGKITYRVLTDPQRRQLYLTLIANEGGGWFSTEIVPFARIETIVEALTDPTAPLLSKRFREAFISRSTNNAGFLAAVLRAEGLLIPVPESAHQHVISGDWAHWKRAMLSVSGESYVPPAKAGSSVAVPIGSTVGLNEEDGVAGKRKRGKRAIATAPTKETGAGQEGSDGHEVMEVGDESPT